MNFSKKIIVALAFFFILCLSYLAYTENKQQNYNYGSSWWTTYFQNPKDESLSFVIENHSSEKSFHWEILADKNSISKGVETVPLGEKKTVSVPSFPENMSKKVTIKISTPKGSKEIYKNF
jgi:hypothetical protein